MEQVGDWRVGNRVDAVALAIFLMTLMAALMSGATSASAAPPAQGPMPGPIEAPSPPGQDAEIVPGQFIVVLKDTVAHPAAVAEAQTEDRGGKVGFVYRYALKGYSAKLPEKAVEALRRTPNVKYVSPVHRYETTAQTTPTGVRRISASTNPALDIDETDDVRIDVDVAVIDSGIDHTHPDLNVVARTNCVPPSEGESEWSVQNCVDNNGADGNGHGTHVAGTVGALDNGFGAVGVAPGARLWAVRGLNNNGGAYDPWLIAGIDWVTARAAQIEVANMSFGGGGNSPPLSEAVEAAVDAGVVMVAAAGNAGANAAHFSPASVPGAITVSALADYDGLSGGKGSPTCVNRGPDDTLASFSNWGQSVDIAAPGVCIYSTWKGGGYETLWGTSMAAPHVSGAAALLAAKSNPESRGDVVAVQAALVDGGSLDWSDTATGDGDDYEESLLYMGVSPLTSAEVATGGWASSSPTKATLRGSLLARGQPVQYRFEYGPTAQYGSATPWASASGAGYRRAIAEPAGLEPGKTYHFRLAVNVPNGTVYGADRTLHTSPWTKQTPTGGAQFESQALYDVSCAGDGPACMAVGNGWQAGPDINNRPISYRRANVTTGEWQYRPVPMPAAGEHAQLHSISCPKTPAANMCMAVGGVENPYGSNASEELVNRWNGTSWMLESVPNPPTKSTEPYARLKGVSCPSATLCVAVGFFKKSDTNVLHPGERDLSTYAAIWRNGTWSLSYPGSRPTEVFPEQVSCPTITFCAAVGPGGAYLTWNGTTWTDHTPDADVDAWPLGVSCLTESACLTASEHDIVGWNGKRWDKLFERPVFSLTNGIDCISETSCAIAGWEGWPAQAVVERWNGSALTREYAINEGERETGFWGVDCMPNGACVGAGTIWAESGSSPLLSVAPNLRPAAVTKPASDIRAHSATLVGEVDPNGKATSYRFEYGRTAKYGEVVPATPASAGSGDQPVAVSEAIDNLKPETEYHFRVVAIGAAGTVYGADMTFTSGAAPNVVTLGATEIKPTEARLNGVVKPKGLATTYRFEYGTTRQYGSSVPVPNGSAGSGEGDVSVHHLVTGLASQTHYHYRLVAINAAGTTFGEDLTFFTGAWTNQSMPAVPPVNDTLLTDLSCGSATSCVAVGNANKGGGLSGNPYGLIQHWNGSKWSLRTSPSRGALSKVSCPSATYCMAVGRMTGEGALAESWDGTSWTPQWPHQSENVSQLEFNGVACTSSSACTAVGSQTVNGEVRPLIERWDGSWWSLQASAGVQPAEGKEAKLNDVSCPTVNECFAVGQKLAPVGSSYKPAPFAEHWNGSSWTIVQVPKPTGATQATLQDLSCASTTSCVATGTYVSQAGPTVLPFAAHWDGSQWSTAPLQAKEGAGLLKETIPEDVHCTAAFHCVAVGRHQYFSVATNILVQEAVTWAWNGTWTSQVPPAAPAGVSNRQLTGVACLTSAQCTAVGQASDASAKQPWVARWEAGAWTNQSMPAVPSVDDTLLTDASCGSATFCVAVGNANKGGGLLPSNAYGLVQHWNGSKWSLRTSPSRGSLSKVSCPSATYCMAVGQVAGGGALAEAWDGNTWTVKRQVTVLGAQKVTFNGVSCRSSSACMAVGSYELSGSSYSFAERWNGNSWVAQAPPTPSAAEGKDPKLNDVSCPTASDCLAVGEIRAPVGSSHKPAPFAEHWNGSSWTIVQVPKPTGATRATLQDLSCASATSCVATGTYIAIESTVLPFAAHWDGSKWSTAALQAKEGAGNLKESIPEDVHCATASDCVVVGRYQAFNFATNTPIHESLTWIWNGAWTSQAPPPAPAGAVRRQLTGISCSSSAQCTAVGQTSDSFAKQPWVARWE